LKKFLVLVGLFITINLTLSGKTYYVATNGSDSNPGTIDKPFATWGRLTGIMAAGDVAYIRGGTYRSTAGAGAYIVYHLEDLHGTVNDTIKIFAYPGEKPVLNLDNIIMTSSYCYIVFVQNCSYLHIKGLRITGLKQQSNKGSIYGMRFSSSSHNLIENIEIDHLGMHGMTFESGSDYNYIKNCDVHHLGDPYTNFGAANGYARTGGSTANNLTFYGCRAWLCSDDGWDMYSTDGYVTFNNCWAFWNGYLDEAKTDAVGGDGSGFKIGPGANNTRNVTRILTNCVAAENKEHGFNQNFVTGVFASHVYNNISYKNGDNGFEFTYGPGGDADVFRNNLSYADAGEAYDGDSGDTQDHNSWNGGVTVTNVDFLSLNTSQLAGPRKADGSLPDITCLHLAPGSDLIDAGINVGMSYKGSAPDIGAFETGSVPVAPPVPLYVSSAIENTAPSVLEITYNLSLANIVPAISTFSVQVNSVARTVNSVTVSGTKVLLTLASPVAYGNNVTVSYTVPSSNPLQTPAGGKADAFSAKSVTNRVNPPPAVPVYVSSAIENAAPSVLEMTYNLTLANIVPAVSAFSVQVNAAARNVNSVSVSGARVRLTMASPAAYGDVVTVSYTVPSSNPLQTAAGGKADAISAKSVTNKVDPPPAPAYVSSSVSNATPSVVEITYSLSLANIVPAASAFMVNINSVAQTVNAVAVSGTKVTLTLATPVVYGNIVTVSYTKPSANPLQTSSGGQAESISVQSVTNNVNPVSLPPETTAPPVVISTPPVVLNTPPVVVVNFMEETYSGFVGKLNASGSYDTNKDNLTYSWNVPATIPVSATNGSVIEFLAPIVDENQTYNFSVTVSDGKDPQTKTIPVAIVPYQPGLEKAQIISIEAVDFQLPYHPYNIMDGNFGTMWSVNGNDQWIILELSRPFNIQHLELAFQPGQKREFYFDILGSNDKEKWEPILTKTRSCSFSGDLQVFEFPASKTEREYKYVKLVGQGNSTDKWNYIAEFWIFGYKHKNPADYEELMVKIYPNPARKFFNILIDEQTFNPDFVKIVSLTGKVIHDDKIDPGIRQLQIPVDFEKGIYIVQMGTAGITMFTQKLVVTN